MNCPKCDAPEQTGVVCSQCGARLPFTPKTDEVMFVVKWKTKTIFGWEDSHSQPLSGDRLEAYVAAVEIYGGEEIKIERT